MKTKNKEKVRPLDEILTALGEMDFRLTQVRTAEQACREALRMNVLRGRALAVQLENLESRAKTFWGPELERRGKMEKVMAEIGPKIYAAVPEIAEDLSTLKGHLKTFEEEKRLTAKLRRESEGLLEEQKTQNGAIKRHKERVPLIEQAIGHLEAMIAKRRAAAREAARAAAAAGIKSQQESILSPSKGTQAKRLTQNKAASKVSESKQESIGVRQERLKGSKTAKGKVDIWLGKLTRKGKSGKWKRRQSIKK